MNRRHVIDARSRDLSLPRVALPADERMVAVEPSVHYTPDMAMEPEWDAETAFKWGFYANTFVYACVRANAEDVASRPIRAGRSSDNPTNFDPRSPLAVLLGPPPGTPNVGTTAEQLLAWSVTQLRVAGRFAWEYEFDRRGNIVGLWPLVAHRLKPIPSNGGTSYWQGFKYDTGAGWRHLSAEQVLYHWRPSQTDWRQPESALQAARLDISVAVMQDRYDYAFLKNDARPAAVVVHEQFSDSKDKDAWRTQFLDRHEGPDNAGKVFFAEADPNGAKASEAISIHTLGLSQKDAEFINRYAAKVRAITVGLGTPLSRIGDASGRTFSNADREEDGYWKHTVAPLMRDLQNAINLQLAPRLGNDVCWFDISDVEALQPPKRFTDASLPQLVQAKIVTKNEARRYLGLPDVDGGDEFDTPTPTPDPAAIDPAADPTQVADQPAAGDQPAQLTDGARTRSLAVAQERAVQVGQSHIDLLEARWRRAMGKLFARQMRETLRRLEGKRGRQATRADSIPNADGVFDPVFWTTQTEEVVDELYEAVVAMSGATAVAALGISFDLEAPWVRAFISERTNRLAGQLTQGTYAAIQRALAQGVADGASIPALADAIRNLFVQTYANRAETVARTEVISSYNGVSYEVGQQYGSDIVAGFEWLATVDERTRPDHVGAHGQVIRRGETFDVGGRQMRYPGDPAGGAHQTVNCRCTILSLTPDDMADRSVTRSALELELEAALALVNL